MTLEDDFRNALGGNVYGFLSYAKETYGIIEDEDGRADIDFNDEERIQTTELFVSVLKKMGIERTCDIIQLMLSRKDLTLLALGRAILDIDREYV